MDNGPASSVRQRSDSSTTVGCDRQRQQQQGRQESRHLETSLEQLLLHLRQELRGSEVLLRPDYHQCREKRADVHVKHMLKSRASHVCNACDSAID